MIALIEEKSIEYLFSYNTKRNTNIIKEFAS